MKFPSWAREPLVHFLVAGVLVFAFFAWRGEEADPASRVIAIDRATQAQIASGFERMMNRAPTDAELDGLIEQYVREEVLYREALRLGFDREDPVVRRRMAQKMDSAASASAETAMPSDAVLRQWHADHPERFAEDVAYSFDQIWFADEQQARAGLAQLGQGAKWQQLGGAIDLPVRIERGPRREVLSGFGEVFLTSIDRLAPGEGWQGPVASGLGWHLVRLRARMPGKVPPLDAIRQQVTDDWRNATIAERKVRAYQVLRDAYRVEIDR